MTVTTMQITASIGGKALWYLTRASGLVSIALLSATIVIGVVASVGWTTARWPRFLSQAVHRNLSLLCITFVGVHVVTTVADGYVPIAFLDVVLPFRSAYRPLYLGLGAVCFDLLLAVLITSGLRHRIGYASWRFVHWLAYLCWPIALLHGLGSGTDSPLLVVIAVEVACTAAVVAAVAWRLTTGRSFPITRRMAAAAGTAIVMLAIAGFAVIGPLQPGWSHRSGTASALLAQLAAKNGGGSTAAAGPATTNPGGSESASGTTLSAPFTRQVTGRQTQTAPDSRGRIQITLAMYLTNPSSTPLTVVLAGAKTSSGGVSLASGTVRFGQYQGTVVGLNGGTITAKVNGPAPETLVVNLHIDQGSGVLTGSISGTAGVTGSSGTASNGAGER